jgi:carbohydrate-selective porin OprB
MFYSLYLDQKLWGDKISIKIGRFATGDDFASSPIYWLYMNNGIDGNPQALPVNTQFSAYPWAVWGARVRVDPTPELNAMLGIYQVSDRIFNRTTMALTGACAQTTAFFSLANWDGPRSSLNGLFQQRGRIPHKETPPMESRSQLATRRSKS